MPHIWYCTFDLDEIIYFAVPISQAHRNLKQNKIAYDIKESFLYVVGYLVSLRTKYLKRNRYRRINFCHDTGAIFTRVKKWTNEIVG